MTRQEVAIRGTFCRLGGLAAIGSPLANEVANARKDYETCAEERAVIVSDADFERFRLLKLSPLEEWPMLRVFLAGALLWLGLVFGARAAEVEGVYRLGEIQTGQLSYPALNNLSFREGTIECWIRIAFDPEDYLPAGQHAGLIAFLRLYGEDGGGAVLFFAQGENLLWSVSLSEPLLPAGPSDGRMLRPGRWFHLALVWQGREIVLYLDGEKLAGREQIATLHQVFGRLTAAQKLLFGDPAGSRGLIMLDDLRVSRVARRPEELGFHVGELQPDIYTAILDPFEANFVPDGVTPTRPTVIWYGEGGQPSAECRFVAGKFGRGLALFTTPE